MVAAKVSTHCTRDTGSKAKDGASQNLGLGSFLIEEVPYQPGPDWHAPSARLHRDARAYKPFSARKKATNREKKIAHPRKV